MQELINNPAVQAGVVPFAAALVIAAVLRKTRYLGLAIFIGFLCAVALIMGFDFESLTSLRKTVLVGVAAAVLAALLEAAAPRPRFVHRLGLSLFAAVGALWVAQRFLGTRIDEGNLAAAILIGVGAVVYCLALTASSEPVAMRRDPVCAAAVVMVTGFTSGVLGLLGASAQWAQFGIAVGAGPGAALLVQMLQGASAPRGWTIAVPAQLTAALIGLLAVLGGALTWFSLLPVPLIALAASLSPGRDRPVWQRAVLTVMFALVPAILAVGIAWFRTGENAA